MSVTNELDGSKTIPVNIFKDLFLLRYLFCDISYDAPGEVVFSSEKGSYRGSEVTLLQSRSGYNVLSKDGLAQLIVALGPLSHVMVQFIKRDYETPLEMYQALARALASGRLPKRKEDEDMFVVDLLLTPVIERMQSAETWDPEKLVNGILKVIHSFSNQSAFKTYKSMYRDKLLSLSSSFSPYRKDFLQFELNQDDLRGSMFQLLMFFS